MVPSICRFEVLDQARQSFFGVTSPSQIVMRHEACKATNEVEPKVICRLIKSIFCHIFHNSRLYSLQNIEEFGSSNNPDNTTACRLKLSFERILKQLILLHCPISFFIIRFIFFISLTHISNPEFSSVLRKDYNQ